MKLIKTMTMWLIFGLSVVQASFAATMDYSDAAFNSSLENGEAVVLDFHASWCPTCRAQSKTFETLSKEEKLSKIKIYKVDYDKSNALKMKYGVKKQSTLILFKDQKEVARSMGVSDIEELRNFLSKGL